MLKNRIVAFFIYWLLATSAAIACSCGDKPTIKKAFEIYDFVAICEVIEIIDTNEGELYRPYQRDVILQVITHFKGSADEQIIDSSTGSNCTYGFRKGREYLVYASGENGTISSTYCGRTMSISRVEEKELKKLEKLKNKHIKSVLTIPDAARPTS